MSTLNESQSSTDDDEENLEALKEATDSQFLKDSLFYNKPETGNDVEAEKSVLPKSLRRNVELMEEYNKFGVSQDFKNFVAKQLAKSLDKSVQEVVYKNGSVSKPKKSKKNTSGIRLLRDSKVNLSHIEEENFNHNIKYRRKTEDKINLDEHISRCAEAAIEPDLILSKASTLAWADTTKGTLYKYKTQDNRVLTEIS
ncbi:uncharacterized protein LOC124299309 [Neodiprion virginianus]|uniref:uncharacterized protein LOC124299309 n=1 Tax=Neodiprion virginianus TaxID=2961670 RepID=UPI001EE7068F|nr:uncharacterized protein LOC124299309 [Neodiprion virginianus]